MRRLAAVVRRIVLVNVIIRWLLRLSYRGSSRLAEWILPRWMIAGRVRVTVGSTSIFMYSEADDLIATHLFYGTPWEQLELFLWERIARGRHVLLDVGANTGVYALLATKINPSAMVYAFEPHPGNAKRLRKNVEINKGDKIVVEEKALGSSKGWVGLHAPHDGRLTDMASMHNGFANAMHQLPTAEFRIRQISLDEYVREYRLTSVDAMKIDVERYELEVLKGARLTIKKFSPVILCEVFSDEHLQVFSDSFKSISQGNHAKSVERFVKSLGYSIFHIGIEGLVRIETLAAYPESPNFLFVKTSERDRFIPYSDLAMLDQYLGMSLSGPTRKRKR